MSKLERRTGFSRVAVVALLLLAALAGCDFGADNITVSTEEDVIFRFTFASDSVATGESLELASTRLASLALPLGEKGYELEQISGGRVTSAVIELLFPLDGTISFTDRAGVRFEADTTTTGEVAVGQGLASIDDDDTAALEARTAIDVGTVLRQGGFRGVLTLAPNEGLRPDEDYELAVQLVLQIDLEIE